MNSNETTVKYLGYENRINAIEQENDSNSKSKSEHLRAEVESLRSMLHRWFGGRQESGNENTETTKDNSENHSNS